MSKLVVVTAELTVELDDEAADLVGALVKRNGMGLFDKADKNAPWSFYDYEPTTSVVGVRVGGEDAR